MDIPSKEIKPVLDKVKMQAKNLLDRKISPLKMQVLNQASRNYKLTPLAQSKSQKTVEKVELEKETVQRVKKPVTLKKATVPVASAIQTENKEARKIYERRNKVIEAIIDKE